MLKSKYNNLILYISAFFIIGLILFAILRDTSSPITLNEAEKLLDNHSVTKVIATKEYVYLRTNDQIYKIASSQVTPKMFADNEVEIENSQAPLLYTLLVIVLLGGGTLFVRWYQKRSVMLNNVASANTNASMSVNPNGFF